MENIYVLIIDVSDENNARKICENIEAERFTSNEELIERLKELELNDISNTAIYNLSDFMDGVNDQILDTLTGCFISFIKLTYKPK